MTPDEIVSLWHERGWSQGDPSVVDDVIGESFVRHSASGTSVRTRAQLKDDLRQYQRALHQPEITVHARVVDGDLVWSRLTMRGCNLDTGEQRTLDSLTLHRIEDGRIVEVWSLHAAAANWD